MIYIFIRRGAEVLKNIFAFIPNEYLKNENLIDDFIYEKIPLLLDDGEISNSFMNADFYDIIDNKLKNLDNIQVLADMTLNLCAPYLSIHMEKKSLTQVPFASIVDTMAANNINDVFTNDIFDSSTTYREDLKNILICSYFYIQTVKKIHVKINNEGILNYCTNLKRRLAKTNDNYVVSEQFIYNKICQWNKRINTKNLNYFFDDKLNSLVDVELLLPFIYSLSCGKNPTNIGKFLKLLQLVTVNKDFSDSLFDEYNMRHFTLMDNLTDKTRNDAKICISMYNQIVLERLTNLNFINKLYQSELRDVHPRILQDICSFANLPLIKTRLNILDFIMNNPKFYKVTSPDKYYNWQVFIKNVCFHKIMCTIPIILLVFHMLTTRKKKLNDNNKKLLDSTIEYFKRNHFKWQFFKQGKNTLLPNMISFANNEIYSSSNYCRFFDNIHSQFLIQTKQLSEKNFFCCLSSCYKGLPNFFNHKIATIGSTITPYNPANDIVTEQIDDLKKKEQELKHREWKIRMREQELGIHDN